MPKIIRSATYPALLYLDAHGGGKNPCNVNPLLEELDAIGDHYRARNRCIICIHDFLNPEHPDWGHNFGDWGTGIEPLSLKLIESRLVRIYPKGFAYHYNDKVAGASRGIIYVYPAKE